MKNGFRIGQLVYSTKGRDQGNFYLVFEIIDDSFVYLVDGNKRRMENPKRKNVKHLRGYPVIARELAMQWEAGQQVANGELRRVVASLKQTLFGRDSEMRG